MLDKQVSCYMIAGHYGSGKTEIADNLAVHFSRSGKETVIADLDIVNPYFRTRECQAVLEQYGVQVISSNFANSPYEDTPGLAPEIASCFFRTDRTNIIDVGGDPAGARVLGRYKKYMPEKYEMWMVINKRRYYTGTAVAALEYLRDIESSSGLHFTGLVNNTNCCEETTVSDLAEGDEMIQELSRITGLPVIAHCFPEQLNEQAGALKLGGDPLPLHLMHRPGWMKY